MSSVLYRRKADLLEAEVGDELVALDPEQGNCFGFNSVATSVWQHLKEPRSIDDLKAQLMADYDVSESTCEQELEGLLQDLESKDLIVRA